MASDETAARKELRFAIGARVAQRRREMGWSQRDVVARIGGRVARLSMIEQGHSAPNLNELLRLREALNVSLDELVAGTAPDTPTRNTQLLEDLRHRARIDSPEELRIVGRFLEGLVLLIRGDVLDDQL
jgi:transcriptional regulator with XRE-family HTH domain